MHSLELRPNNYKLSIRLHELMREEDVKATLDRFENKVEAKCKSSAVLRARVHGLDYYINKKGHVNVTGTRTVDRAVKAVSRVFSLSEERVKKCMRVDNISANGKIGGIFEPLDLRALRELAGKRGRDDRITATRFDPDCFPSLLLWTRGCGTISIFSTGSVICVGAKSFVALQNARDIVINLVRSNYALE